MSTPQWRNNPIEKLENIVNPEDEPTFADFESWKDTTFRSCQSVGITYVKKLIYNLQWEGGDPPVLVTGAAAPETYSDKDFQQAVVRQAANEGRRFSQQEPTGDLFFATNYDNIVSEISSFGQQVAKAAKRWHSEVFTLAELTDWPLRPILEWQTIESEYNPTKGAQDTANFWKDLNAALVSDISLEPSDIRTWIN
mmetsp:Transcript_60026/g.123259  ORF Transcript_60026/g.123259 Transcript_60026/m.123259 type:complete len:196 (-) Transcript_60026:254-841(-)